jgi:hypothetical protein
MDDDEPGVAGFYVCRRLRAPLLGISLASSDAWFSGLTFEPLLLIALLPAVFALVGAALATRQ